jgi:prepilin-type N-terminal cleavage/methylation domain-containing protein
MTLRSAGPRRGDRRADGGFTLIELVIALALSSLIVGVITAALITSLNVSSSTTAQVNDSNEAGLASAFLFRDAQSAGGILPATAFADPTRGVSTTDWAGCTQGSAALVVRFSWIEQGSTPASSNVATYAFAGSTLTRQICKDGVAGATVVLGSHFASAVASCLPVPTVTTPPTPNCAGRPTSVSLTVTGLGARAPLSAVLTASLRASASQLAIVGPSSPLTAGQLGTPYPSTLIATIGAADRTAAGVLQAPTWAPVNALPAGLTLGSATGRIDGTPTLAGAYSFTVAVTDALNASATRSFSISVNGSALGLFAGHQDIGATGRPGDSTYANPTYTLSVGKGDIGGVGDQFQFLYRPLTGDGSITARVASQTTNDGGAQAGVMFRETLDTASSDAMMGTLQSSSAQLVSRNGTGTAATIVTNAAQPAPYWVRLTRAGNLITAEQSVDGVTWIVQQQKTIVMSSTIYVGLAVSSHNNAVALSTTTFDNVTITP